MNATEREIPSLLAEIEREVPGWDGVWKKRDEHGPGGRFFLCGGADGDGSPYSEDSMKSSRRNT